MVVRAGTRVSLITKRRSISHAADFRSMTATAAGQSTMLCHCINASKYPVGRKITDEEFAHVNLTPDNFHGESNYTIHPNN